MREVLLDCFQAAIALLSLIIVPQLLILILWFYLPGRASPSGGHRPACYRFFSSVRIPAPECDATILPGSAMKETIRAFLLGMLILLTALIPPTILLVEYFRR